MSVTTVRLQPEVEVGLETMSGELRRTKSWVINQALREYIARAAVEQSRWQGTLAAMESVARGEVVQGDSVHDWLQSWGTDNELPPPVAAK